MNTLTFNKKNKQEAALRPKDFYLFKRLLNNICGRARVK